MLVFPELRLSACVSRQARRIGTEHGTWGRAGVLQAPQSGAPKPLRCADIGTRVERESKTISKACAKAIRPLITCEPASSDHRARNAATVTNRDLSVLAWFKASNACGTRIRIQHCARIPAQTAPAAAAGFAASRPRNHEGGSIRLVFDAFQFAPFNTQATRWADRTSARGQPMSDEARRSSGASSQTNILANAGCAQSAACAAHASSM